MTNTPESLSIKQARKLVLLSQKLPPKKQSGSAKSATLSAVEHLGYIQIDTISVIQRAHHHTLWNRNPRYQPKQLDRLVEEKKVFEYWSHAASYLPMCDYRFSLSRKHAFKTGELKHWYPRNGKLLKDVLDRIKIEGPLMARDFADSSWKKTREWQSKPSKQALEYLFMQGDLMISSRSNFHKVYDLTERVLPPDINNSLPTSDERAHFLITQYLKSNGIGQASQIAYLLKKTKAIVLKAISEMVENGDLLEIDIEGQSYIALPDALELLDNPLSRTKLKILSPFDNLLIQRKRTKTLFDFDYLIECYVPAAKRKYGYFSLPILWNSELVARVDCKANRKTSILHINHLALEAKLKKKEAFAHAFAKELKPFMSFHDCKNVQIHTTSPGDFKEILKATS